MKTCKLQSYLIRLLAHSVGVDWQYGILGTQIQHSRGTIKEESAEVGRVPEHIGTQELKICAGRQKKNDLSFTGNWESNVVKKKNKNVCPEWRNQTLFAEKRFKRDKR